MEAIMETEKAAEVQLPVGNGQDRSVDMKQVDSLRFSLEMVLQGSVHRLNAVWAEHKERIR